MKKRKHDIPIMFWVTEQERDLIEQRMKQIGTTNMSAYLRKIAIDGYVLKLDLPELKEMISMLRRSSNNLNQIAKRVNETGRIYDTDIEYLCGNQEQLWAAMNEILTKLAALE